ncbi:MAG TPA: hypothetical protein VMO17_04410 [Terriglobia bacterium]|nr:hypothetical protein [Terriglobia bacterium]
MPKGPLDIHLRPAALRLALSVFALMGAGAILLQGAQKPQHTGTMLEGYATVVEPTSITVFDKKNHVVQIVTDKDYTSLVGIAAPVTVWYTTAGGVNHLEEIIYPTKTATFVPTPLIRERINRIAILPEVEEVKDADGLISAISSYLAETAGWFVAPSDLALEIAGRNKLPGSTLDAVDPNTGDVDMESYMRSEGSLMKKIASETHTDAVLEVRIVRVKADVHGTTAQWDDMTEPVVSKISRVFFPWEGLGGKNWVAAASAEMNLWYMDGRVLWKKRRGFAALALQSGAGGRYHERPLMEVYANTAAMYQWLAATFGDLVPPAKGEGDSETSR